MRKKLKVNVNNPSINQYYVCLAYCKQRLDVLLRVSLHKLRLCDLIWTCLIPMARESQQLNTYPAAEIWPLLPDLQHKHKFRCYQIGLTKYAVVCAVSQRLSMTSAQLTSNINYPYSKLNSMQAKTACF